MTEKKASYLEADILSAFGTGKSNAQTLYHNLQDLILGASCGLELSEVVLIKFKNPEETEKAWYSA